MGIHARATIENSASLSGPVIKRGHLLDLPTCVLEKIFRQVGLDDRGLQPMASPPYKLLPLALTCKALRRVAGLFLTHDTMWNFDNELNDKQRCPDSCPELSDDVNELTNVAEDLYHHRNTSCTYAHRQLAWYNLAVTGLECFDFGRLCFNVPAREVIFLSRRMGIIRPPIRELKLDLLKRVHPYRLKGIIPAVATIICVASQTLESLEVHLSTYLTGHIIDAICSHPLPQLKSLVLHMSGEAFGQEIAYAARILNHCLSSEARIERIGFACCPPRFAALAQLAPICPYVRKLELGPPLTSLQPQEKLSRFSFPDAYLIEKFNPLSLTIKGIFNDECLKNISHYVAFENHFHDFHLSFDLLRGSVFNKILIQHHLHIGCRIKSLSVSTYLESNVIESIAEYCPNLKNLNLACTECSLPAVDTLITNLKYIEVFGLQCCAESTSEHVKSFLEGTEDSECPIKQFRLSDMGLEPWQICNLVSDFEETLEVFQLSFGDSSFVEYDLRFAADILQHIQELSGFEHLRELSFPFSPIPAPAIRTIDEEILVKDVRVFLKKMKKKFKHLDVTALQKWINFSYLADCEDDYYLRWS